MYNFRGFLNEIIVDFLKQFVQVLVAVAEPRDRLDERAELHHVLAPPPLLVHLHLRAARHAVLRGPAQLPRGHAHLQL